MVQLPWQITSQPPEPVQRIRPRGPISTVQWPEPVQAVEQAAPQAKAQWPEPVHWRLQSPTQSTLQSPLEGQLQPSARHSHAPLHSVPRQPARLPTATDTKSSAVMNNRFIDPPDLLERRSSSHDGITRSTRGRVRESWEAEGKCGDGSVNAALRKWRR